MLNEQKNAILSLFNDALVSMGVDNAQILLERPKVAAHGDLACNVAMQLARQLKKNPRAIATELIERIQSLPQSKELIESFEIAGPGFINMRLSQQAKTFAIREVLRLGSDFGKNKDHAGESILIEYVSANPTGPLHLGHARQGALGDVLSNLMRTQGWNVCREFYYNDAGVQIQTLTESVRLRIKELLGETITFPENGYQGLYIKDIAKDFLDKKTIRTRDGQEITASGNVEDVDSIRAFSVGYLKNEQDSDLNALGVSFDNFYLESSLYSDGLVERAVNALIASGHTYEQDGALWLRTTDFKEFGDDKDRVMRKQDGHYTYFVPDVAYHLSKFERGFVKAVDIQGSDHHGTTARVRIGVQVAGQQLGLNVPKVFPVYVLHKMLKVIKNGEEVKMSKRSGTYVTLRDLVNWVGKDAAISIWLCLNRMRTLCTTSSTPTPEFARSLRKQKKRASAFRRKRLLPKWICRRCPIRMLRRLLHALANSRKRSRWLPRNVLRTRFVSTSKTWPEISTPSTMPREFLLKMRLFATPAWRSYSLPVRYYEMAWIF